MLAAIVGLVGLVTTLVAWRAGYAVGRIDGRDGVSQCWPWSDVARDREEG
jgi:hypothetical protein